MSPSISLNVLLQCGLLLLCANCVRLENYKNDYIESRVSALSKSFSWWPSVHNGALLRSRRQANTDVIQETEGGKVETKLQTPQSPADPVAPIVNTVVAQTKDQNKTDTKEVKADPPKKPVLKVSGNATDSTVSNVAPTVVTNDENKSNTSITDKSMAKDIDFNSPGVMKRGIIVFGGFALLAVAYFIFYRRKNNKKDSSNTHNTADANQFRYGVLQSDDQRDNLELSRVPLTMESDDDDDEDLEIFDLEQKKKSLSYVNLQLNDEDVVLSPSENRNKEMDNLLLDIEDGNSETLINWSSSGNKSII